MAFKLKHLNAANLMKGSPLYQTAVPKGSNLMVDPNDPENLITKEAFNSGYADIGNVPEASVTSGIKPKGTKTVKGAMYEGKGNLSKSTGQTKIVSQLTGGVVKDKANPNAKPSLSTDPKKVDVAIGGIHDGKEVKLVDGPKRPTPSGHSGKGYKTGKDSKKKINILSEYGGVPETVSGKESNKGKSVDTKSELVKQNKTIKDQNTAMESGNKADLALLGADAKKRKVATSSTDKKSTSNKKKSTGVANTKAGDALKGHSLPSEGLEIKPFNPSIGGGSSNKGGSGSSKKQNKGQIGGYLENAIKKGDISLGVDLKMPKFEGTISRATDPGHNIISQNSSYGGRVGRVKRRQERKTARTAQRVDNRINRMQGKQESASQERKNLKFDNPVVEDATGVRQGSKPGKTITNKRTAKGVKVEKEPKLRGRDKRTAKFTEQLGNTSNPNAAKATPRGAKTINPTTSDPKLRVSQAGVSAAIDASRAISGVSSSKPKSTKREGTFDYSQSSKTLKKRYKK